MAFNIPNLQQSRANKWHEFRDDFDRFVAADWTVTTTGTGTTALENREGGALLITNSAANNDAKFLQLLKESFTFNSTRNLLFRARFQVSDAILAAWVMGLQITDTTPLAVSDGMWFDHGLTTNALNFHVASASVQTDLLAFDTMAAATMMELVFHFVAAKSKITIYKDGVAKGSVPITNAPLSTRTLAVSFGLQNGEGVAKTMSVDYIEVIQDRA